MSFLSWSKRNKNYILNFLGILFLTWGMLAVFNSLYFLNPGQIFWNCYIGLLLIGTGILIRNSKLIGSQLVILGIPLLVWDIDFLYWIFAGKSLWGVTDYFFVEEVFTLGKIISLQHLFTGPLALYAIYLNGVKKVDFWKVSIVQVTLLYFIILFRTNPSDNVGCVFESCLDISLNYSYRLTWFLVFFGLIFLTNWLLMFIPWIRKGRSFKECWMGKI